MIRLALTSLACTLWACGGASTPKSTGSPSSSSSETVDWELPPERELASRRVRRSSFAHLDPNASTEGFTKLAGPFQGQADERELPRAVPFSIESGKCYQLRVQADTSIQALAVVVEDRDGGIALDESGDRAPAEGALCADRSGSVDLKFASGLGKGAYSIEVWGR